MTMDTTKTIAEVRPAMRQQHHAMIGNLHFGPIEAVPLKHSATKLHFRTVATNKTVAFNRSDLGESVFVEYFIPETTPAPRDETLTNFNPQQHHAKDNQDRISADR